MKKQKIKRNHSIGMPLVRVIPSLTMMTWNREAMKAFHGQTRDLVCHNLGNGRIILRAASMTDLAKKISRNREAPEFTLRLVVNRNRAISRTPKTIQTFLRENSLPGGPFVGKAIRHYAALYVNFSEAASGESISIGDILESAPVVKFPKVVEATKESKPRKVKKAKKSKKAKKVKKTATVARKPKTEKPVAKKAKPARPKKVVAAKKAKAPSPKSRATIDEDEEQPTADDNETTPLGEVDDDESQEPPAGEADETWDGSVEDVADEEGDEEEPAKLPSPVRASRTSD